MTEARAPEPAEAADPEAEEEEEESAQEDLELPEDEGAPAPADRPVPAPGGAPRHERHDFRPVQGGRPERHRRRGHGHEATPGAVAPVPPPKGVHRVLLMNATEPGEVRVAILEDGQLAEIFVERKSRRALTGHIFKGRVVNVEPSLQAAFVEMGQERHGFLHASDCLPPDGGFQDLLRPGAAGGEGKACAAPPSRPEPRPQAPERRAQAPVARVAAPVPPAPAPSSAARPAEVGVPAGGAAPVPGPGAPGPGQPGQGKGKRRRRRRGGRGRSGRARREQPRAPLEVPGDLVPGSNGLAAAAPGDSGRTPAAGGADNPPPATSAAGPETAARASAHEPAPRDENVPPGPAQAAASAPPGLPFISGPANAGEAGSHGGPAAASRAPGDAAEQDAERAREDRGGRPGRENGRRGRENGHDGRYTIQEMLHKGQEVLVQVAKEGLGQKGPALTTYLSIPGRYLVLMPALARVGVSKRIEDEGERRELKEILSGLHPPAGMGLIIRTAGQGRGRTELERDLKFLTRTWETLCQKARTMRAPARIYEEGDVVTRVLRDVLTDDVAEIVVDEPEALERARVFLRETAPDLEHRLRFHQGPEPLFQRYGVEAQIQRLFHRKVNLPSGGSIVIEQTEALLAIDVNTGRFREKRNQEDTILATNLEAAREVSRQLRLRDAGGLIMIDFIDMEDPEHRRRVERELRAHLARDKARINVLPISLLGMMEMTRQRVRHSLRKTFFERCPYCAGTGHLKSAESMGLEVFRELRGFLTDLAIRRARVVAHPDVVVALVNGTHAQWARLEEGRGVRIEFKGDSAVPLSQWQIWTAREEGDWVLKKASEVDEYVRNS